MLALMQSGLQCVNRLIKLCVMSLLLLNILPDAVGLSGILIVKQVWPSCDHDAMPMTEVDAENCLKTANTCYQLRHICLK